MAAALQEAILDEFPNQSLMPQAHELPKTTDLSIDQRSLLKMQMELNQSSRMEDLLNQDSRKSSRFSSTIKKREAKENHTLNPNFTGGIEPIMDINLVHQQESVDTLRFNNNNLQVRSPS